ncbi:MAG: hypothetical protein JNL21_16845 [Myxococcales bacterium]|nr:hypothetical protein [Myxococcales bacterium]
MIVFVDGWTVEDGAPQLHEGAPRLAAIVRESAWTTIGVAGSHIGLEDEHPPSEHVAYRAAGVGSKPKLASEPVEAAVRDDAVGRAPAFAQIVHTAMSNSGKVTDFIDGIDKDACTVHVFALLSDSSNHGDVRHLNAVVDVLAFHDLPFVVHAFVDGVDTPEKSAWPFVEALENRLQRTGRIATISGRTYAFDSQGDWDKTLELYRAVVHAEADRYHDANQALASSYAAGYTDANLLPVIVGEYRGVQGGFGLELPSDNPEWRWRGEDVGVFVGLRSEAFRQLAAVLTRTNLPDHVAEQVTLVRRPVVAFDTRCLASFVRVSTVPELAVVFPEEPPEWSLGAFFAARGDRQLRIGSPGREDHVEVHFDGGGDLEGVDVAHAPTDGAALTRALEAVEEGSASFVVVGLGGVDRASRSTEPADVGRAFSEMDEPLGALAARVRERGGLLLITSSHGPPKPRSHVDDRVPLVLVGPSGATLRPDGTVADLAATVLEWLGEDAPESLPGRSLLANRSS